MARLKLGILTCTIYFSMTAFSQTTTSLRSKILALDDYQDAPQLWKLYNDSSSVMDEATRLHAKVSLNYYFNRPDEMLQCVDSLLTLYPEECLRNKSWPIVMPKQRNFWKKGTTDNSIPGGRPCAKIKSSTKR